MTLQQETRTCALVWRFLGLFLAADNNLLTGTKLCLMVKSLRLAETGKVQKRNQQQHLAVEGYFFAFRPKY